MFGAVCFRLVWVILLGLGCKEVFTDASGVKTESDGSILLISIDRPEKLNAVDSSTAMELTEAFRSFEIDDRHAVAVLYGKGSAFCAGLDLEDLAAQGYDKFIYNLKGPGEGDGPMGPSRLKLTKPVIVAIEGYAVAQGLELALLGDLRVVAEDAVMAFSNRKLGIPILDGGSVRLPYIIGISRALDLIMTGRRVDGKEAYSMGLADRVVPKGMAVEEAKKLAKLIAKYPQEALRADRKSAYYASYNADSFYDSLTYEYRKGAKVDIQNIKNAIAQRKDKNFVDSL